MSVEERTGVLDRVTGNEVEIDGNRLYCSKWFEGDLRLEQANVGHKVTVLVDVAKKCTFLKRVFNVGEKVPGWKPPEGPPKGGSGGFRGRMSPEELDLKRAERDQIRFTVAVDRTIQMKDKKLTFEDLLPELCVVEEYLRTGKAPDLKKAAPSEPAGKGPAPSPPSKEAEKSSAPPVPKGKSEAKPARPKPKRLESWAVNGLFNQARRGGLVVDWMDYQSFIQEELKLETAKSPYHLSLEEFAEVEAKIRKRLSQPRAA